MKRAVDEHLAEIPGIAYLAPSLLQLARVFWPESFASLPNSITGKSHAQPEGLPHRESSNKSGGTAKMIVGGNR